jgi:hypothetical protein
MVYNKMIEKLKMSNRLDVIEELENSAVGAATGGEGLALTGKYLLNLKCNNPLVYELIKDPILEYLNYCKENGFIIE